EFLRRARDHLVAERRQGVLQVRQGENLDDRAIERGDDRFWRSGRDEDSDPTIALDIGVAGFGHRWHVGQRLRAGLARYRERPQRSVLDVWHDRRRHVDPDGDVAGYEGGDRRTSAGEGYVHEVEAERQT